VQPFHPAFQVRLRRPAAEWRAYRREVDFTTGVVSAECGGRRSEVFVSRADDVVVQRVTESALTVELTLDHRLPGAPRDLTVGHGTVLTIEGALLTLRARYPGSDRAYTGVTLVVVTGGRTRTAPPGVRVESARSVLLLTRVRRHTGEPDALARLHGIRTRFGAAVDLVWSPGERTAVIRPTRTLRIDLRTSSGARPLSLRRRRLRPHLGAAVKQGKPAVPPPMEGTPWQHAP
jgi:hypothetical protein